MNSRSYDLRRLSRAVAEVGRLCREARGVKSIPKVVELMKEVEVHLFVASEALRGLDEEEVGGASGD